MLMLARQASRYGVPCYDGSNNFTVIASHVDVYSQIDNLKLIDDGACNSCRSVVKGRIETTTGLVSQPQLRVVCLKEEQHEEQEEK